MHGNVRSGSRNAGGRDLAGYAGTPPRVAWPEGARLAVSIAIDFEEGAERNPLEGDAFSEAGDPESVSEGAVGEPDVRSLQAKWLTASFEHLAHVVAVHHGSVRRVPGLLQHDLGVDLGLLVGRLDLNLAALADPAHAHPDASESATTGGTQPKLSKEGWCPRTDSNREPWD